MDVRVGLILLVVLGAGWHCDARQMAAVDTYAAETITQEQQKIFQAPDEVNKDNQVCSLCEQFATDAIDYLAENQTQTAVVDFLHQACSRVPAFKQECITMVDYYAPLFFLEISSIQPDDLCQKVNLCQEMVITSSESKEDGCEICHHAVSEVLVKLKDPDTQLEILELLLKGCNSMENYARKCKKMVFEYGPLILANAEQFLETKDICTLLHACDSHTIGSMQASMVVKADA